MRIAGLLLLLAVAPACAGPPDAGEWGRFRHFGQVPGEAPLTLLPPTADRQGNLYVLWGGIESLQLEAFVGKAAGGWVRACSDATKGTEFGAHGWVGHVTDRAWYWSGGALIELQALGACSAVLNADPASGASLDFRAIVPRVRETPSRTTAVAWVQSPSDPVPFQVLVDLNARLYSEVTEFEPGNATELQVLGVGADPEAEQGVVVVRYRQGSALRVQARFFDDFAKPLDQVALDGLDELPEYGILGYAQANDAGLYAGLLSTGQVLVFDKSGGRVRSLKGMTAMGVHRFDGALWVVGENDGRPMVAAIDDEGGIGGAETWESSRTAAGNLKGDIEVVDDRVLPSHTVTWKNPRSAIGTSPFLSSHSPDPYADGTTLWAVTGPVFDFGGEPRSAVAVAPVGLAYP